MRCPALTRAEKLGRRAARVGFDWPDAPAVSAKVREEFEESEGAIQAGDAAAVGEEIGDLLFSVVNWARHLGVNSEQALQHGLTKIRAALRAHGTFGGCAGAGS